MKKVLFVADHRPDRAPNQRFRFEQYFSFLEEQGFECHLSYLLDEKDDEIFYRHGYYGRKAVILVRNFFRRLSDLRYIDEYDLVFVAREAAMTGSLFFEKRFSKAKPLIYDFDDAIWLKDVSEANRFFGWLKHPPKVKKAIAWANVVFAGNAYLADYARQFNRNVVVIPTTVDTNKYRPDSKPQIPNSKPICIGWSGSLTTIKHFEHALPFLQKLKQKYGDGIRFKVIGDATYRNDFPEIKGVAWNKQTEVEDLADIDIGIMPLPDNEWTRGKCGLKGLTYMALEIPTVMSPVGVNKEIIQDGVNGFLAGDDEEWIVKISTLIDNPELRKEIGIWARQTVIGNYSVESQKQNYLYWFRKLTE